MTLLRNRRGAREATLLALGLWTFSILLWLLPQLVGGRRWPSFLIALCAATLVLGLLFSALLYLVLERAWRLPILHRIAVFVGATLLTALVHAVTDAMLIVWMRGTAPLFSEQLQQEIGQGTMPFVLIFGLYATALGLLLSALAAQEQQRALAEARSAMQQAQIAALRFQLNPHFLFNTLNALSTLVMTHRNPEAETMIERLSEFLRASLRADPESEVAMDEELETIQAYLDIERVRFGDRLALEVSCPSALLDVLVPSFLLQPLVENAVKYAVAPSRRPVTIRVVAWNDREHLAIRVEDDGLLAPSARPKGGTGLGLSNTRRRLMALYGADGTLEAAARNPGFTVELRLPIRRASQPPAAQAA
ncbi:sensor histidine kinase [Muricoccus radiodurans]|uniref:sensor histidine kinase n=1 Tax=Muricoccus radiodurans TaxID=2231721 RepID=UPI003CEBB4DD